MQRDVAGADARARPGDLVDGGPLGAAKVQGYVDHDHEIADRDGNVIVREKRANQHQQ